MYRQEPRLTAKNDDLNDNFFRKLFISKNKIRGNILHDKKQYFPGLNYGIGAYLKPN